MFFMQMILEDAIDIKDISEELKNGSTIVYPTETCYGLGCDATNQSSVDAVFHIKKRQKDKTVLVLMADIAMAQDYVQWSPALQYIADTYWPGALTVVAPLKKTGVFAHGVEAHDGTIAFRISSHPTAAALVKALKKPLVSTSANISSEASPYDIETILRSFAEAKHQPNIVIDGGDLPHQSPSTIVSVVDDTMQVLRQGNIVLDEDKF